MPTFRVAPYRRQVSEVSARFENSGQRRLFPLVLLLRSTVVNSLAMRRNYQRRVVSALRLIDFQI